MAKLSYGGGCDVLMGDHGSGVKVALLLLQKKAPAVDTGGKSPAFHREPDPLPRRHRLTPRQPPGARPAGDEGGR